MECTYEFEVEVTSVKSKAEAIRVATTEALEDMTFKKAKAKEVVYLKYE